MPPETPHPTPKQGIYDKKCHPYLHIHECGHISTSKKPWIIHRVSCPGPLPYHQLCESISRKVMCIGLPGKCEKCTRLAERLEGVLGDIGDARGGRKKRRSSRT
jgi:hypothetical protein